MQKYYIFLNLGPAASPAQANISVLQLPIIEMRAEVLLGLARADDYDYAGNAYPISQTMAGIEIEVDTEEFQAWYRAFTTFPLQAISEA